MSLILFEDGQIYNTHYIIKIWYDKEGRYFIDHQKYGELSIGYNNYKILVDYVRSGKTTK